jgi:hypothetical protein
MRCVRDLNCRQIALQGYEDGTVKRFLDWHLQNIFKTCRNWLETCELKIHFTQTMW